MCGNVTNKYRKVSLWISAGLTFAVLMIAQVAQKPWMLTPLVICALFSIVADVIFHISLKIRLRKKAETMMPFLLVQATILAILAALAIIGYICSVSDKGLRMAFVLMLAIYYFALLIFDIVFIMRLQKNIGK